MRQALRDVVDSCQVPAGVSPGCTCPAAPMHRGEGLGVTMNSKLFLALFLSASFGSLSLARPAFAQACKDDESIVKEYDKDLNGFVQIVKKESQSDFDRFYHQKSCLSKLTFCLTAIDGLLSCLDKAAQDSAAPKEEADASKAKRESYGKLKGRVGNGRKALKDSSDSKQAKALIEKFDFPL